MIIILAFMKKKTSKKTSYDFWGVLEALKDLINVFLVEFNTYFFFHQGRGGDKADAVAGKHVCEMCTPSNPTFI